MHHAFKRSLRYIFLRSHEDRDSNPNHEEVVFSSTFELGREDGNYASCESLAARRNADGTWDVNRSIVDLDLRLTGEHAHPRSYNLKLVERETDFDNMLAMMQAYETEMSAAGHPVVERGTIAHKHFDRVIARRDGTEPVKFVHPRAKNAKKVTP